LRGWNTKYSFEKDHSLLHRQFQELTAFHQIPVLRICSKKEMKKMNEKKHSFFPPEFDPKKDDWHFFLDLDSLFANIPSELCLQSSDHPQKRIYEIIE
jgi:hypothetical protein